MPTCKALPLFDEVLVLGAYYRYATLAYRSLDTSLVQHGVGGNAMLFPNGSLLFTAQGEAITGDDSQALMFLGSMTWRPRL
jgi:hypothetical protein